MASRTREDRIIAAVPCSVCGARVGELCEYLIPQLGGIVSHSARRKDWQAAKAAAAPVEPVSQRAPETLLVLRGAVDIGSSDPKQARRDLADAIIAYAESRGWAVAGALVI